MGFVFFCGSAFILSVANYTWNSNRVLTYFERPETKIPRKYKMNYRLKHDKEAYYVRFDLMLLLESVMSDLKLSKTKTDAIDVYTADSFKLVAHGCMSTHFGLMLGLPYFFEWNSVDHVDFNVIRHKSPYYFGINFTDHILTLESLNLNKDELLKLKETFVLSEKAKKFALAQKLLEMESLASWAFYAFTPILACWVLNMMAVNFNDIFKMLDRPTYLR